ncbi:MAG TPA: nitroreductase family deazaflavin-dependent oxidoreductase [Anaerolineaceae bacterium]|jgi:deazaflavin-dependent oxidoreductase (nitroreductase family)|nr:nitroreductase family deazaflavin-dependent oxidoreductase [Anaerolineaceae bacterium]
MTQITPEAEKKLQQGFKYFNKFMLLMWRLGLGSWVNISPATLGRIMVLTHTGRRSGLRRQTPVNYAEVDGEIYCTAGFGGASDWYRNLIAHPQVEVWLPNGWWSGEAIEVTEPEARLRLLRQVLIASGFAARVAGINPHTMTDDELAELTTDYRVLRIRRTAERTGPQGPGDLAWVWPLATFLLLPLVFRRKK